ncbi:MAG: (2Fe-2S) ferredoxin domain-containing protein [Bacteroidales bacterium]|nr:(2Fe-2S) ferredoxin domain-containing protein [Bacteroidales bacterium]MCU0409840.1 (2Fe-2S) ferredoxin domain-containing protein [Bacteroidales bacterium]
MNKSYEIEICLGSSCFSRGNREVVQVIRDYLRKNHLDDKVVFKGARCMNRCSEGPFLIINGKTFIQTTLTDIEKILEKEFTEPGR